MNTCEYCGRALPEQSKVGRRRHYCDATCRKRAQREQQALPPQEMMLADRWVRWKTVRRGEHVTKMPIQVDGIPASSTNPATWTSYPVADESTIGNGLGFMLGDGFACIDLDHCYDARNHLADWAKFILRLVDDTFIELSPSGDGLHIWGLCAPQRGLKIRGSMNVEAYSNERYITVTSKPYKTSVRKLADLTRVIEYLTLVGR